MRLVSSVLPLPEGRGSVELVRGPSRGRNGAVAVLAACACLVLAGCAVGPKYKRPGVQTPPAYKENAPAGPQWQPAKPSEGTLRGKWWELFGDPQLNQLEEKVSVSNQNVKMAEAQFSEARAVVRLNRANYYPTITAQPSITPSLTSNTLGARSFGGGMFTEYALPFGASWEPDLWGRVRLAVENAYASAQTSAADLENVRLSMQAELAADYFQMLGLDMQEKLLSDTLTAYEKALQLTINRYHGGVASKADVAQAQTQLASTRAQLTDLGILRSQMEHAIAVLTGQPPSTFSLPPGLIRGTPPSDSGRPSFATARAAAGHRRIGAAGGRGERADRAGADGVLSDFAPERHRRSRKQQGHHLVQLAEPLLVVGPESRPDPVGLRPPEGAGAGVRGRL